jgi:hypothetical protein
VCDSKDEEDDDDDDDEYGAEERERIRRGGTSWEDWQDRIEASKSKRSDFVAMLAAMASHPVMSRLVWDALTLLRRPHRGWNDGQVPPTRVRIMAGEALGLAGRWRWASELEARLPRRDISLPPNGGRCLSMSPSSIPRTLRSHDGEGCFMADRYAAMRPTIIRAKIGAAIALGLARAGNWEGMAAFIASSETVGGLVRGTVCVCVRASTCGPRCECTVDCLAQAAAGEASHGFDVALAVFEAAGLMLDSECECGMQLHWRTPYHPIALASASRGLDRSRRVCEALMRHKVERCGATPQSVSEIESLFWAWCALVATRSGDHVFALAACASVGRGPTPTVPFNFRELWLASREAVRRIESGDAGSAHDASEWFAVLEALRGAVSSFATGNGRHMLVRCWIDEVLAYKGQSDWFPASGPPARGSPTAEGVASVVDWAFSRLRDLGEGDYAPEAVMRLAFKIGDEPARVEVWTARIAMMGLARPLMQRALRSSTMYLGWPLLRNVAALCSEMPGEWWADVARVLQEGEAGGGRWHRKMRSMLEVERIGPFGR